MTIKDLIDIAKFDFNIKNNDYAQKNCSKDNNNAFLKILESANKSYNFSFDKTEKFSHKNLNHYKEEKNYNSKDFKSDYENFYNKFDAGKNNALTKKTSDSKSREAVYAVKQEKSETASRTKESVAEAKQGKKEINSEAKKSVSDAKETKRESVSGENSNKPVENNTNQNIQSVDSNNTNISGEPDIQECNEMAILDEQSTGVPQNTSIASNPQDSDNELNTNISSLDETEELTDIQKQIQNEKITNKQAENILQQQMPEEEEILSEQELTAEIPQEDVNETQGTASKEQANQSEKLEVLISEDILDKLDDIDNTQTKHSQNQDLKPLSGKLAETINNQDSKPVITNIEIQNNSSKMNSDSQNQGQARQETASNVNQINSASSGENNLPKVDIQKTSSFDKVMNSKQSHNLESSVLNQMKDKLSTDISTNKSAITLSLRPEHLGKVNVNIVSQNGILTAQITAENNQVKDILSKGLETLRQHMAEQGINVGKMVVNVQEPQTSNQNMNSEQGLKDFAQSNSDNPDMNNQPENDNYSEQNSTAYSNNEMYEFEQDLDGNINETSTQTSTVRAGQVDYKV